MSSSNGNIEYKNCPHCGSDECIKRGKRQNKNKTVQLFFCKSCKKRFTDEPVKFKTYDTATIIQALSLYNKGLKLEEISAEIKIPRSTINNWQKEYGHLFNLKKYAKYIQQFSKNNRVIQKYKYIHKLIYVYKQNSFKLESIIRHKEKRLYDYLQIVSEGKIENNIFHYSTLSASQVKLNINHAVNLLKTNNNACKLAAMALTCVDDNKKRHSAVEKIMLENDITTIAVEVPVFLNLKNAKMPWLRTLQSANGFVTGHIDILQFRNNKVYILDYKPNADKEKPLGQLFIYACCISNATGIPFKNIELAWFDENVYYETGSMQVYKYLIKENSG
jgi:transposase-like protein